MGCKRFIELIWDLSQEAVFRDKYAESLSTSIHFHNQCAHSYMAAVCEDLEMHFTEIFSADMYDLLEKNMEGHLQQTHKTRDGKIAHPAAGGKTEIMKRGIRCPLANQPQVIFHTCINDCS